MAKIDINSLELNELKEYIMSLGEKTFVAKQIYSWLHVKNAESFDEMTNLSKALRQKLSDNYELYKPEGDSR